MRPRPDLTYPALPDPDDLDRPTAPGRSVDRGSSSLRDDSFEWPASGPSESSKEKGLDASTQGDKIGPFGAKVVAAMTGAVTTSLLSEFKDDTLSFVLNQTTYLLTRSSVTPFDVLKTRLQTVQPHPQYASMASTAAEDCCQTSILTPTSNSRLRLDGNSANPLTCYSATATEGEALASVRAHVSFASLRPSFSPAPPPSGCLNPSKWAGIWGEAVTMQQALARGIIGTGNGATATLVLPMESGAGGVMSGFWNEVAAVRRETGVKGLWKGVGTTL